MQREAQKLSARPRDCCSSLDAASEHVLDLLGRPRPTPAGPHLAAVQLGRDRAKALALGLHLNNQRGDPSGEVTRICGGSGSGLGC